MISSGGQYYSLGRTEGLFLKFKIFFAIIWFHMVLVTSQQDQLNFKLSPPPTASTDNSTPSTGTTMAADASIMTLITSPNGTPEVAEVETTSLDGTSSVLSTLSRAEKAKITVLKTFNTSGVKSQSNICNLSSVCSDSVFYRGVATFEDHEESNITQDMNMNQDAVNATLIEDLPLNKSKLSELNKTLESLSESYVIACSTQNQSISNCTFTIKVNMTVNICPLLLTLKKIEVRLIEQCCCSFKTHCPSSPKDLEELQCELKDPVKCHDSSHLPSPVFPSTGKSIPASPLITFPPKITPIFIPPNISSGNGLNTPFIQSATWDIHLSPTQPSSQSVSGLPQPEASTPSTLETRSSIPSINSSVPSTNISTSVTDLSTRLPHGITENFTTSSISASEIENKVSQMEKSLSADSLEPSLAEEMIREVSRLLHAPPALLTPLSQRLLKVVDDIGFKLNFSNKTISFTSPSLALAVVKTNASTFTKTTFAAQDPSDLQVTLDTQAPENSIGIITLPTLLLDSLSAEEAELATRIQFNFFETPTLISGKDPSLKNLSLISYVISSSVTNLTIKDLRENVTVTLQNTSPTQDNLTVKCAFWDLSKNGGRGGWSSEGCTVKDKRMNETVCSCNHLTSFGVLLDLSKTTLPPVQMLILTFITYIGCGLSAIFLSVTLVTYIAFEKIRRDYPSKILIQLCAALLLLNLVFLLDSWIALYNIRVLCISVAVFLHYFLLVSFTWMGLEAFHMYLALVKVFNTYIRKYILKFCIVGWLLSTLLCCIYDPHSLPSGASVPAVIIAIVLAISPDNYGLDSYGKFPNGSPDEFCWINNSVVFYITVVGYFCVIFLLNVSMFIVVLVQLCRIKKKKQLGAQRKTSIQDLRSVAGLTFLLGITWGFAFFAWGPVNLLFIYLFAIFNTLQGFFIFIFYCVAKENVRKQWRRYLCCGRYRLAENSDWSRTATNGLKKQIVNQGVSSSSNSLQSNSNSTNSTTLLVNNDCSVHANGNGNASTEKNGVSFSVQNGDVCLHDFSGKQHGLNEKEDACNSKNRISLRRTSKRGSLHFVEQM